MTVHADRATPLGTAPFSRRIGAKLIDLTLIAAVVAPLAMIAYKVVGLVVLGLAVPLAILGLITYTAFAEYRTGHTLGKRLMGLRVVSESGGHITMRQSFVRQLPLLTDTVGIDTVFALFTEKGQRVFELASRTRVVRA